jgi:hypothetical protein
VNGVHDLGGMQDFGPVEPEPNEPPFHSQWEARSLALNRAMSYANVWTIDRSRAAIEELPPVDYLSMSYYEKWAARLEKLLLETGLVEADEIAAGRSLRPGKPLPRTLAAAEVGTALTRGSYAPHPRLVRAAGARAGALQGRRPRAHPQHASEDSHEAAALRARAHGRDRSRSRLLRISRHRGDRARGKSAMALHGSLRRPRIVGRERRSDAEGLDRSMGTLPGAGMMHTIEREPEDFAG